MRAAVAGKAERLKQEGRIKTFQQAIKKKGWGGALLFYSRDIFYYTGTAQPAYLLVTPSEYLLFVRRGFDFALEDVFIEKDQMVEERDLALVAQRTMQMVKGIPLGTELDLLPANQLFRWKTLFPDIPFVDASPAVLSQRRRKDAREIHLIKEACAAQDAGHRAILHQLRPGVSELELAACVEQAHRLAGHEGVFFMRHPDFVMSRGPIASGRNLSRFSGVVYSITGIGLSPAVPAGPSRRTIATGDFVVVDIPTLVGGYHADQTRTYCLGKPDTAMADLHAALVKIADCVIAHARPGARCSELFLMAEQMASACDVDDAFLSFGNGRKSHMIGHGIGLECTEPPVISKYDHAVLEEDEVMAVEMHGMREGVRVIKIEDMVHIGPEENTILTKSPRTLFEVLV
jgi:Xaa-Pro aminopeptidase